MQQDTQVSETQDLLQIKQESTFILFDPEGWKSGRNVSDSTSIVLIAFFEKVSTHFFEKVWTHFI